MTFSCLITPLLLCLSFIISVDGQVTTSIPVGINGQLNACNAIVKFCPGGFPQSPDCVDKWCKGGPNGPCDPHCCSQPNRLACIESIGSSASGTSISSIVSGLASMTSGLTATFGPCENVKHMELSCLNKDPVFAIEPMTQQAKCLCFDNNGQYAPNAFDYDASSCYESLKSAKIDHRQDFSKSSVEFCSKYVGAGPTTSSSGTATTASSGQTSSTASPGSKSTSTAGPTASASSTPSATSPPNTSIIYGSTPLASSAKAAAATPAMRIPWMDSVAAIAVMFLF